MHADGYGSSGGNAGSTTVSDGHVVLPKNVKPTHYHLTVEPDLDNSKFYGTVVIDLDVLESTTSISLNSTDLDIKQTQVNAGLRAIAHERDLVYNKEEQTVTVNLADTLPVGTKATLTHTFQGYLTDSLSGCYKSLYTGRDGEKKWLATTLFEPTYARKAFPCFDEPALKARFTISILADKGLTCLSNMDVKHEIEITSPYTDLPKQRVDFNVSPIMSTYLVAYIVGELNVIENNDFRVPIRVFTTPDKDIEHGRFALDLAVKVLNFYEDKFDSAFPLPKMDMVAIPDFMVGAMENWGLVTYRVTALLYDEKTASSSAKIRVAEVVAHELAHQWFGNLVTMDFWEGLWLNEGFATFMSWLCCNAIFPEWKIWEGYITTTYADAMELDSLRSSHAIELPVKHAEEIEGLFDHISYKKGSGVLRMLCRFLGEEVFLKGVCHYVKAFAYSNTHTDDLWVSLSHVSGKDVRGLMDIWTRKIGYPIITVTEEAGSSTIRVKQNRYLKSGDAVPEEDETLYPVVLGVRNKSGSIINHVLTTREMEIKIDDMNFFKLNADHAGMFRTSYSPERLLKLGQAGQQGLLTVEDKAGMIADASALATSGYQKTSTVLALLQSFRNENEPVVWEAMRNALGAIRRCWLFEDSKTNKALDQFTLDLVHDKAHTVGWEIRADDGLRQRQWKKLFVELAGNAGDVKIQQWAVDSFQKFTKHGDRNAVNPELRDAMFALVLKQGGAVEYEAVWHEFKEGAKSNTERDLALAALGNTRQPELIERTLDLMLSEDVRSGEVFLIPSQLKDHRAGKMATLPWLKRNFPALEKRLKDTIIQLDRVVDLTCSGYTTAEHEREINDVFDGINVKPFEMKLRQNLDKCKSNAGWLERDRQDVAFWLAQNNFMS